MRAMPSPMASTVPTSASSVSTSYCSIRSLRIDVISSGRSFKGSPYSGGGCKLSAKSFETAAHARVDAQRPGLEHDAADQSGIDAARRLDLAAGCVFDLLDDLLRFLV